MAPFLSIRIISGSATVKAALDSLLNLFFFLTLSIYDTGSQALVKDNPAQVPLS